MNQNAENPQARTTPQQWEMVRGAYVRGEGSLRQLAARHGLSLSTTEARCRRQDWVALRHQREENAMKGVVGETPVHGGPAPVEDATWWKDRDKEHLLQNLELTGRLRQAVEGKIPGASATELERLAGALEAVVGAERTLLELTPRSPKQKGPSLRPRRPEYGSREWCSPVVPIAHIEPTIAAPGQTVS
jgi:hypothetical protein